MKSLALASKVKSLALASRPKVLEKWPVLGSRTALVFELLKFCGALKKFLGKRFFVEIARKIFVKTFFFLESTCACVLGPWPWPRAFLSLASRVSVLGKAVLGLGLGFFLCLGLGLEPCVLDSTSVKYSCITEVAISVLLREYQSSSSEYSKLIECSSRAINFLQFLVIILLQYGVIKMF